MTDGQRTAALARAQVVRLERADLRRGLAACPGDVAARRLAALIADPPDWLANATVDWALQSLPALANRRRRSPEREAAAAAILEGAGVLFAGRAVGDLTDRQRRSVAAEIVARYG